MKCILVRLGRIRTIAKTHPRHKRIAFIYASQIQLAEGGKVKTKSIGAKGICALLRSTQTVDILLDIP